VKNQSPLQFVNNVWSKCLVLHLCARIVFPSKKNYLMKYCNLTTFLKSIMRCEVLGLDEVFQGTYFGHVFFKVYQYVTIGGKVCKDLRFVSIKFA